MLYIEKMKLRIKKITKTCHSNQHALPLAYGNSHTGDNKDLTRLKTLHFKQKVVKWNVQMHRDNKYKTPMRLKSPQTQRPPLRY